MAKTDPVASALERAAKRAAAQATRKEEIKDGDRMARTYI